jgi:peptidyl-prolyl cis-trans isomerase SurA
MAGRLAEIEEQLDRGVAFEDVARNLSEGPNASRGGLVGTFARGDLFSPVLEEVAWELPIGEISDPIQTEIGIHYVQVTGRTENDITLRQIMLRIELTAADRAAARTRAAEVVRLARSGQDFGDLARIHSDDPSSRDKGGLLGSFTADQLSPQFLEAIRGVSVGEITDPVEGSAGLFILKLLDRQEGAVYTFEEVEDRLRQILMEQKIEGELREFISGLREEFFIEIKA